MAKEERSGEKDRMAPPSPPRSHTHGAQGGTIAGEILGALVGSTAGVPGAIAGMVLGSAMGALAGRVIDIEAERTRAHDEELDKEIGVNGGPMGALQSPASRSAPAMRDTKSS